MAEIKNNVQVDLIDVVPIYIQTNKNTVWNQNIQMLSKYLWSLLLCLQISAQFLTLITMWIQLI